MNRHRYECSTEKFGPDSQLTFSSEDGELLIFNEAEVFVDKDEKDTEEAAFVRLTISSRKPIKQNSQSVFSKKWLLKDIGYSKKYSMNFRKGLFIWKFFRYNKLQRQCLNIHIG